MRVLGGRGAVEDEEDLPDLSDSGDEAAWEDEDDAELPHDKQQTPCLFCDRCVRPAPAVPGPRASACPALAVSPGVWSAGWWRRETPVVWREEPWPGSRWSSAARLPLCNRRGFCTGSVVPNPGCGPVSPETLRKEADAELRTTVLLGQGCGPGISFYKGAGLRGL